MITHFLRYQRIDVFHPESVTRTRRAPRAPKLTAPRGCLDITNSAYVYTAVDSCQRHTAGSPE